MAKWAHLGLLELRSSCVAELTLRRECASEPGRSSIARFTRKRSAIANDFVRRRSEVPDAGRVTGAGAIRPGGSQPGGANAMAGPQPAGSVLAGLEIVGGGPDANIGGSGAVGCATTTVTSCAAVSLRKISSARRTRSRS